MDVKKPRREKGTGTIYQRKDGTWAAQIKYNKPNGEPGFKTFRGKKELDVRKQLNAFRKELDKDDPVVIQANTVREYLNSWLENTKQNELKDRSYDRLEATLNKQVYPAIGKLQVATITPGDIQTMLNGLVIEGKSYSTIKKAYEAVNSCFKNGVIRKQLKSNPCLGISLPEKLSHNKKEMYIFDEDERNKIIAEATRVHGTGTPVYRQGYGIIFLMYTGMRVGEALGLKWADVNFETKNIAIKGNMVVTINRTGTGNKYIFVDQNSTKTKSGKRNVPMSKKAEESLLELQKINGKFDKIFSTKAGKSVSPRNIDRMFRNILTVCEIPLHGVHSLRHTFASMVFEKGVDVKTVSEILGHSDVYVTYNTYIHLINDQKKKAIALLDD